MASRRHQFTFLMVDVMTDFVISYAKIQSSLHFTGIQIIQYFVCSVIFA